MLDRPVQFAFGSEMRPWLARLDRGRPDRSLLMMAREGERLYLEHIREAVAAIERYIAGKTFEDSRRIACCARPSSAGARSSPKRRAASPLP